MGTLTPERARFLLGGGLNGHDPLADHPDHTGMTMMTGSRRCRSWRQGGRRGEQPRETRPGMRLIGTGAVVSRLASPGEIDEN